MAAVAFVGRFVVRYAVRRVQEEALDLAMARMRRGALESDGSGERALNREVNLFRQQVLRRVLSDCRQAAPVRTGRLKRSLFIRGNRVVAGAPYAKYVVRRNRFMRTASERAERRIKRKRFRVTFTYIQGSARIRRQEVFNGNDLLRVRYSRRVPDIRILDK